MRKIILSLMAIVLAVALTAGAASALFSDTATITGITFATGNADLQVAPDISGAAGTFGESYDTVGPAFDFNGLLPGVEAAPQYFWLRNASSAGLNMTLGAQLTAYTGDNASPLWNNVEVAIVADGATPVAGDWHTLTQWWTANTTFNGVLNSGLDGRYEFHVRLSSAATVEDTVGLDNVVFTFTGTQAP